MFRSVLKVPNFSRNLSRTYCGPSALDTGQLTFNNLGFLNEILLSGAEGLCDIDLTFLDILSAQDS